MERALTIGSWIITLTFLGVVLGSPLLVIYAKNGWFGVTLLVAGCLVIGLIWASICRVMKIILKDGD